MSQQWINARDVAAAMWPGKRPPPSSINSIMKGAEDGEIQARAASLTKVGIQGRTKLPPGSVPAEFWGGREMIPDWELGVFAAKVQNNGLEEEWRAYGVTFDRAAIEALAPPKASAVAASPAMPPPEKNRGGSPVIYDWAVAVGTLIFQWVEKGTWHPKDEKEVRKCLQDHFASRDQHPDSKMLKSYAEWLFQEFEKRKE